MPAKCVLLLRCGCALSLQCQPSVLSAAESVTQFWESDFVSRLFAFEGTLDPPFTACWAAKTADPVVFFKKKNRLANNGLFYTEIATASVCKRSELTEVKFD